MNCEEAHLMSQMIGEGEETVPSFFEEHLSTCSNCKKYHEQALAMSEALNAMSSITVPETFKGEVMSRIATFERKKDIQMAFGVGLMAGVSLLGLIIYILSYHFTSLKVQILSEWVSVYSYLLQGVQFVQDVLLLFSGAFIKLWILGVSIVGQWQGEYFKWIGLFLVGTFLLEVVGLGLLIRFAKKRG